MSRRLSQLAARALVLVLIPLIRQGVAQTTAKGFVIADVSLFDGKKLRTHSNVVVEGGIVSAVDRQIPIRWRDLPVIRGAGATLLPGLIDAHTHTGAVARLRDALRFGVTTILDMWTPAGERALREAAASRLDVSAFRSAGILAAVPGGHGTEYGIPIPTVAGPSAAEAFVAARKSEGADYLKIVLNGVRAKSRMPTMDAATARALVQAAHARGLLVVAHIENLEDAHIAVTSGVDGLAHVWRVGGAAPDLAGLIVERHVFVVPTLATPDSFIPGTGAALAADPRIKPFLPRALAERLIGDPLVPGSVSLQENIDQELAAVGSLVAAGTTLLAGTDPPNGHVVHGVSLHRELELLVRAGLTPLQALAAATKNAADAFHLSDRGRITVGTRADMVLVPGDPSRDITATRDIVKVWRSGVEFDRKLDGQ
jgi:imidazolonepropionase-like amidohydrolase